MAPVRCRRKSSRPVEPRTCVFTSSGCRCCRLTTRARLRAWRGILPHAAPAISTIRTAARAVHSSRTTFTTTCAMRWRRCRKNILSASGWRGGPRLPRAKARFGMRSCSSRRVRNGTQRLPGRAGGRNKLVSLAKAMGTSRRGNSCGIRSRSARSSRIGLSKRAKG